MFATQIKSPSSYLIHYLPTLSPYGPSRVSRTDLVVLVTLTTMTRPLGTRSSLPLPTFFPSPSRVEIPREKLRYSNESPHYLLHGRKGGRRRRRGGRYGICSSGSDIRPYVSSVSQKAFPVFDRHPSVPEVRPNSSLKTEDVWVFYEDVGSGLVSGDFTRV